MHRQTLREALHLASTGKSKHLASAARALHGKPEGGWPETMERYREMVGDLPYRDQRAYTVAEWVEATHELVPDPEGRAAGHYRSRYAPHAP